MNVLPAWQKGFTGRGVVVTILDDGIEKDHPDLKKNYVSVYAYLLLYHNHIMWICCGAPHPNIQSSFLSYQEYTQL